MARQGLGGAGACLSLSISPLLGKKRAPSREQLNLKLISPRRVGTHQSVHHITSRLQAHLPHTPPSPPPTPTAARRHWLTFQLDIERGSAPQLSHTPPPPRSYIYSRVVSLGRVKGRRSQAIGAGEEAGKRTSRRSGGSGYRQASSNDSTPCLRQGFEVNPREEEEAHARASMACSCGGKRPRQAVPLMLALLLVVSCSLSVSASGGGGRGNGTRTAEFRSGDELRAYRSILARMDKMKKASVKTIQSSDGDVIHCVPAHLQPAFDHPTLRGQKPEAEPEERPKMSADAAEEEGDAVFPQAWSDGGESCPGGTVPIRRTTESDLRRYSGSLRRYGMKPRAAGVRRDSTSDGHEHAVGYVTGDQFYGAKASLNVWPARVASAAEFSLSQIWVISGTFGNDLNTIEAGWQVSPQLYGDNSPRFFTYWTSDAYQATGCYNLHCSGFVQTNRRISIGAAISPASAYNGRQFDISLLIWKDPRRGHWWLQLGSGPLVGYWPSSLFSHLGGHANMVQFGGEVVNTRPSGSHTPTQMGSGHFPREGFNRAAYFRNVQVVDWDNNLLPARDLRLVADHPACYGIQGGYNRAWGNYFYYGGPGRNVNCP